MTVSPHLFLLLYVSLFLTHLHEVVYARFLERRFDPVQYAGSVLADPSATGYHLEKLTHGISEINKELKETVSAIKWIVAYLDFF